MVAEMVQAYQVIIHRLKDCGLVPKHHCLNNKMSVEFEAAIKANGMTFQLVTLHNHQMNTSEKAIQAFKEHFIVILRGVAENFPLHLWDKLLPQADHMLNLWRQS